MNQNAFQNTNDNLLPQLRVRALLIATIGTICGLAWSIFYLASDGFTQGTLSELASIEKHTLDQMQDSGIVVRDAALPCTMNPHVVVRVNWNTQQNCYCVSAIGLRNVPFESVLPFISRFAGLKEIKTAVFTAEIRINRNRNPSTSTSAMASDSQPYSVACTIGISSSPSPA